MHIDLVVQNTLITVLAIPWLCAPFLGSVHILVIRDFIQYFSNNNHSILIHQGQLEIIYIWAQNFNLRAFSLMEIAIPG